MTPLHGVLPHTHLQEPNIFFFPRYHACLTPLLPPPHLYTMHPHVQTQTDARIKRRHADCSGVIRVNTVNATLLWKLLVHCTQYSQRQYYTRCLSSVMIIFGEEGCLILYIDRCTLLILSVILVTAVILGHQPSFP